MKLPSATTTRMRFRAWLGLLLLVLAQVATGVHAARNDHAFPGAHDELCYICLHGDRNDGAPPPAAAPVCGPATGSLALFFIPQDRRPLRPFSRAHGARAPPLHSSTA